MSRIRNAKGILNEKGNTEAATAPAIVGTNSMGEGPPEANVLKKTKESMAVWKTTPDNQTHPQAAPTITRTIWPIESPSTPCKPFPRTAAAKAGSKTTEKSTAWKPIARMPEMTARVFMDLGTPLTTQAQRPGPRDATIATATLMPGPLQRLVSPPTVAETGQ